MIKRNSDCYIIRDIRNQDERWQADSKDYYICVESNKIYVYSDVTEIGVSYANVMLNNSVHLSDHKVRFVIDEYQGTGSYTCSAERSYDLSYRKPKLISNKVFTRNAFFHLSPLSF